MRMLWNPRLLMLLTLVATAVAIGACGGDDEESASTAGANGTDRAFVAEMVPHHESAVEMAKVAQEKAQHDEVKRLADAIIQTQNAEIETMNALDAQMENDGVEKGDLGMKMNEMDMSDMSMLENAKPFDREFIDMMIPHHQDAIVMARMELEQGKSADAMKLAEAIIDAQTKEIDEMNMWRVDWYGKLSPAGGVPAEDEEHH